MDADEGLALETIFHSYMTPGVIPGIDFFHSAGTTLSFICRGGGGAGESQMKQTGMFVLLLRGANLV